MHFVYAGIDQALNRRSLDSNGQIFIVKFGYCKDDKACRDLISWEDRFNDGFKNKNTGIKETLPLALYTGWRRIAMVEVGEWARASRGIESSLKEWADAKFGMVRIMAALDSEVEEENARWKPGTSVSKNGLGELRHIPFEAVPNLVDLMRQAGINDPLAEDVIRQLGSFLEAELRLFSEAVGLRRSTSSD